MSVRAPVARSGRGAGVPRVCRRSVSRASRPWSRSTSCPPPGRSPVSRGLRLPRSLRREEPGSGSPVYPPADTWHLSGSRRSQGPMGGLEDDASSTDEPGRPDRGKKFVGVGSPSSVEGCGRSRDPGRIWVHLPCREAGSTGGPRPDSGEVLLRPPLDKKERKRKEVIFLNFWVEERHTGGRHAGPRDWVGTDDPTSGDGPEPQGRRDPVLLTPPVHPGRRGRNGTRTCRPGT